jgi:hypothetical protein
MAQSMLDALKAPISDLNPADYQAGAHVTMSGDEEADRSFLHIACNYPSQEVLDEGFEELIGQFNESYDVLAYLLREEWALSEGQTVDWPVDDTPSIASYYTEADMVEYDMRIARWEQPKPGNVETVSVQAVHFEPFAKQRCSIKLFYLDDKLFAGRALTSQHRWGPEAAWDAGYELTPDDAMFITKLIKSVGHVRFDTLA